MLRSYLITALRSFLRNRLISVINVLGLAAGIAASVMIMLYVYSELSVDKFNENYDRIFRLEVGDFCVTGTAPALILKNEFPGVRQVARMDFRYRPLINQNDEYYRMEHFVFADSTIFDLFTVEFLSGDPVTALQLPFSLVLTRPEAVRLFGDKDPQGRIVMMGDKREYTVTAVIEELGNSHLPFTALGSFSSLQYIEEDDNHDRYLFNYMNFLTYVLLHENADHNEIAQNLDRLVDERYPDARIWSFRLRPLSDIYFNRELDDSPPVRHGNLPLVYTLIAVAGLVLLIAIINFINLSTANAASRYSEIGMRKVLGAERGSLVIQFLTESVIMTFGAFLVGIGLVEILLPVFSNLLSVSLVFKPIQNPVFLFSLLFLVIFIGLLAGLYPAFYLSSLRSMAILKGEQAKGRGAIYFRRLLIVFQFSISIALIISTITVHRQVTFMRDKDLGFNKEDVIIVRLNRDIIGAREVFKNSLLQNDAITGVSFSNNLPGYVTWFNSWIIDGESKPHRFLPVDPDYIDVMDIEILSGRNFEWERASDMENTFILNEEAVRYFGFDDPSGREFMVGGPVPVRVIGVVSDFHFRSLHEPVGPLVLGWQPNALGVANIRVREGMNSEALNHIMSKWDELAPGSYFEYRFLEDELDNLYRSEIRIGSLFRYFVLVAVIIASMGLYGLSTFISFRRSKEVGIRKVLGSSVPRAVLLLVTDFSRWVLVSNLIAWPLAWLAMSRWLENFPYRIGQSPLFYILAGIAALVIAVITVGGQAWLCASANPAKTLRTE